MSDLYEQIEGLVLKQAENYNQGAAKLESGLKELKELRDAVRNLEERNGRLPLAKGVGAPSLGRAFIESNQFAQFKAQPAIRGRCTVTATNPLLETKVLTPLLSPSGGAGSTFVGQPTANLGPVPGALQLVSTQPVNGGAVSYLRMSIDLATQKAAAQHPEGSAKASVNIGTTLINEAVGTVACYTKASVQLLSDVSALQSFIDGLLRALVLNEVDDELLNGGGPSAGELTGITALVPAYDTAADVTGDSGLDTLSHAILQLEAKGVVPTAAVVTPTAAESLRLTKTTTGEYIGGFPTSSGDPWGLRIIPDANLTGVDFIVGDFSGANLQLLVRQEATVDIALENEDDFIKNLMAIRAEMRGQTGLYNLAAFLKGSFPTPGLTLKSASPEAPASHPVHSSKPK
jgi:HK97 family phage major capsid protein